MKLVIIGHWIAMASDTQKTWVAGPRETFRSFTNRVIAIVWYKAAHASRAKRVRKGATWTNQYEQEFNTWANG